MQIYIFIAENNKIAKNSDKYKKLGIVTGSSLQKTHD